MLWVCSLQNLAHNGFAMKKPDVVIVGAGIGMRDEMNPHDNADISIF